MVYAANQRTCVIHGKQNNNHNEYMKVWCEQSPGSDSGTFLGGVCYPHTCVGGFSSSTLDLRYLMEEVLYKI